MQPMKPDSDLPADLQQVIAFHGHLCPGLVKGYRAAKEALQQLGVERAEDEELVAIVENDACGVDAFQALTGCTFGKGNLIFRDYGKHVFTLARRSDAAGVRLSAKRRPHMAQDPDSPEARARLVLSQPLDDLFEVRCVTVDLPPSARLHESIPCEACGEPAMATRTREIDGRKLCVPCSTSM